MSQRYAVVSIGTNSTRALLADVEGTVPRVTLARSIGTRIGEGVGERGELGEVPMRRTLDALTQLHRALRGHYVRLLAVATSALRRANNGDAFLAQAESVLGVPVRVLSGEEEAAASYRGAVGGLRSRRDERLGVVDAGGGSTEYAYGSGPIAEGTRSYEIGAVVLTDAVPVLDGSHGAVPSADVERARSMAAQALQPLRDCDPVDRIVLVGGTATTVAAIIAAGRRGASLGVTRAELSAVLDRLTSVGIAERKAIRGMRVQRADILPAGIVLLEAALESLGVDAAVVTASDLLLGVLLEARGDQRPAGGRPVARAGHN